MRTFTLWGGPLDGKTVAYAGPEYCLPFHPAPAVYYTPPDAPLTPTTFRRRWHIYMAAGERYVYQGTGGD